MKSSPPVISYLVTSTIKPINR